MRLFRVLPFIGLLFLSAPSLAKPEVFEVDESVKPKSFDRYIRAVHKELETGTGNLDRVRYAILEGMLTTKGFAWVYQGEGEGYILARFDYRGDTNVMRIEYDQTLVQLKYHAALGDYVCKNLVDDICYKNSRGYYNYIKNLRNSISKQLKRL